MIPGSSDNKTIIFRSLGDGDCAYNTVGVRMLIQTMLLKGDERLFDPSSPTYAHYHKLLDVLSQQHPELKISQSAHASVEQRFSAFLTSLSTTGTPDWLEIQRTLAPAIRAHIAQHTSIEMVQKGSDIAQRYKNSMKAKVLNTRSAYALKLHFEGKQELLTSLEPVIQNILAAIAQELKVDVQQLEAESRIEIPEELWEELWKEYAHPLLEQWFEQTGYQAYLNSVNRDNVAVGVEEYPVVSHLYGMQINYVVNEAPNVQRVNATALQTNEQPIILNAKLNLRVSGDHWDFYLEENPVTQAIVQQNEQQRQEEASAQEAASLREIERVQAEERRLASLAADEEAANNTLIAQLQAEDQLQAQLPRTQVVAPHERQTHIVPRTPLIVVTSQQPVERQVSSPILPQSPKNAEQTTAVPPLLLGVTSTPVQQPPIPSNAEHSAHPQTSTHENKNDLWIRLSFLALLAIGLIFLAFHLIVLFIATYLVTIAAIIVYSCWKNWDILFGNKQPDPEPKNTNTSPQEQRAMGHAPTYAPQQQSSSTTINHDGSTRSLVHFTSNLVVSKNNKL